VWASELGTYLYCRRAWWYQRQGREGASPALDSGLAWHHRHGRRVLMADGLRITGWIFVLLAAAAAAVLLAQGLAS